MEKQRKINSSTSNFPASLKVIRRPNKTSDRERERVRGLSKAFSQLKTTLPWLPADTKLSKLDTLKLASWYISYLVNLLNKDQEQSRDNCNGDANAHSESLSWPSSLYPRSTAITQAAAWPGPPEGLTAGTFWGTRRNKTPRANQDSLQRNNRHSDDKKTKLPFNTSSITPICECSSDDNVGIS